MAVLEKIKSVLEWIEHGRTLWELFVLLITSLGGGSFVRAWLIQHTQLAHVWITPIWLLTSAFILWLIGRLIPRFGSRISNQTTLQKEAETGLVKGSSGLDLSVLQDVYKRQHYIFTSEAEENVKDALVNVKGAEREKTLVRCVIAALRMAVFAEVWQTIYGSQLRALVRLNRGPATRTELQTEYTSAAAKYPGIYTVYSYDSWLGFLRKNILVVEKDGSVAITVRGQAFLQHMTQIGRTIDDKPY